MKTGALRLGPKGRRQDPRQLRVSVRDMSPGLPVGANLCVHGGGHVENGVLYGPEYICHLQVYLRHLVF